MRNKKRFNKIVLDIKKLKIQGARNIARAALYACSLDDCLLNPEAKKKLMEARPTEPMLVNVLHKYNKIKPGDWIQDGGNDYVQLWNKHDIYEKN